jgi:hypothetical protein
MQKKIIDLKQISNIYILLEWLVIGCGLILRFQQYLYNRPLWHDEALLVLNLIQKDFNQLFHQLNYFQVAPLGFLLLVKVLVNLFGNTEYVFRFIPFIASIVSIFIFYQIIKLILQPEVRIYALSLFCFSSVLIYYSSECKQYSMDVLSVLILFRIWFYVKNQNKSSLPVVIFSIVGAILVWFSHPIIFILTSIYFIDVLSSLFQKNWIKFKKYLLIHSIWILSFILNYSIFSRKFIVSENLGKAWNNYYMPLFPISFQSIKLSVYWICIHSKDFFIYLISMNFYCFFLLIFLGSIFYLLSKDGRKIFYLFIFIVFFTFFASALHKYPIHRRVLLFLIPLLIIILSNGISVLQEIISDKLIKIVVSLSILLVLFFNPLHLTAASLISILHREKAKTIWCYIKEHKNDQDEFYIYYGAVPSFQYYRIKDNLLNHKYLLGLESRKDFDVYLQDIDRLLGKKRVWIVFEHVFRYHKSEKDYILKYLNEKGTMLDYVDYSHQPYIFINSDSSAYLYNLTGT